MDGNSTSPRKHDSAATKRRILAAAKAEFAEKGLGGARVDAIAARARANKRMIYHYFGNKEALFLKVLETAYMDIRSAEQELNLASLPPRDALIRLVEFTWGYYLDNPEFITLVNSENLHRARHLKQSRIMLDINRQLVDMVDGILKRGVAAGEFRDGISSVQLNITIAAIGYYYLTNRFTGSIVYGRDLETDTAFAERLAFNTDTILRLVLIDSDGN